MSQGKDTTYDDPFEELRLSEEAAEERRRRLAELGHHWDHTVRAELQRLAHALWPNGHALERLSVHRVRLRRQAEADAWVWWLERDIPPYDRFHCEAYRVTLRLSDAGEAVLSVESGAGVQAVTPLTAEGLEAALARAGGNPPLLIPRTRGDAGY